MRILFRIAPRRRKENGPLRHYVLAGSRRFPSGFKLLANLSAYRLGAPHPPRQIVFPQGHESFAGWHTTAPSAQLTRQSSIPREGELPPCCTALRYMLHSPVLPPGKIQDPASAKQLRDLPITAMRGLHPVTPLIRGCRFRRIRMLKNLSAPFDGNPVKG